jgi:hypothetical protein
MDWVKIETDEGRTTFFPGDRVSGSVEWELEAEPRSVELRLFWYTSGKGDQDVGVAAVVPFEGPGARDRRGFEARLPLQPYSFSGALITVSWALEVIVEPGSRAERLDLVVSPTGAEIHLPAVPQPLASR